MGDFIKNFFDDIPESFPSRRYSGKCEGVMPYSFKQIMNDIESYSTFKKNEYGTYVANINIADNVSADMIDIQLNEKENTIKISYQYKTDNVQYTSSVCETLPVNADSNSLKAVLDNGVLVVTMDEVKEKTNEGPVDINIKRIIK